MRSTIAVGLVVQAAKHYFATADGRCRRLRHRPDRDSPPGDRRRESPAEPHPPPPTLPNPGPPPQEDRSLTARILSEVAPPGGPPEAPLTLTLTFQPLTLTFPTDARPATAVGM